MRLFLRVKAEHWTAPEGGVLIGRIEQNLWVDVTICNVPSGVYSVTGDAEAGEPLAQFAGMANYLYDTTKTLEYEGAHTIVDVDNFLSTAGVETLTWMGKVLNLTGGDPAWATMRALLHSVDEDLDSKRVTLKFGPAPHLGLGDLLELTRNNRGRRKNTSRQSVTTGESGAAGSKLGTETGSDNAHQQTPYYTLLQVKEVMQVGDLIAILLSDAKGKAIALREYTWCYTAADGSRSNKRAIMLGSELY